MLPVTVSNAANSIRLKACQQVVDVAAHRQAGGRTGRHARSTATVYAGMVSGETDIAIVGKLAAAQAYCCSCGEADDQAGMQVGRLLLLLRMLLASCEASKKAGGQAGRQRWKRGRRKAAAGNQ